MANRNLSTVQFGSQSTSALNSSAHSREMAALHGTLMTGNHSKNDPGAMSEHRHLFYLHAENTRSGRMNTPTIMSEKTKVPSGIKENRRNSKWQ